MRLNHLDLHVPDVAATRDFFVRFFGLRHEETRGDNALAILRDDAGMVLIISKPFARYGGTDQVAIAAQTYHIGFLLPDRAEVDATYAVLKAAEISFWHEPRDIHGGYVFYCTAPGNILVEVGCRPM